MANRQPRRTEASRHVVRVLHTIGGDLREARLSAGLTQTDVALALGTTRRRLGRIESGRVPLVPLADLAMHAGIVGLRFHAKLYPAGSPLRDKAQLALLDRFRRRLSPTWHIRLEEPIPIPGDQRAWDMVLRRGNMSVGVEAVSPGNPYWPTSLSWVATACPLPTHFAGGALSGLRIRPSLADRYHPPPH